MTSTVIKDSEEAQEWADRIPNHQKINCEHTCHKADSHLHSQEAFKNQTLTTFPYRH